MRLFASIIAAAFASNAVADPLVQHRLRLGVGAALEHVKEQTHRGVGPTIGVSSIVQVAHRWSVGAESNLQFAAANEQRMVSGGLFATVQRVSTPAPLSVRSGVGFGVRIGEAWIPAASSLLAIEGRRAGVFLKCDFGAALSNPKDSFAVSFQAGVGVKLW